MRPKSWKLTGAPPPMAHRAAVGELIAAGAPVWLLDNPAVIIPSALNVAPRLLSHTKYVARVDGHAEISPDYLARAIGHLDADPSLAGVGGRRHGVARTGLGLWDNRRRNV